jgi:chemotaxis protein methyltransferase CheR
MTTIEADTLSSRDMNRLRNLIYEQCGITLAEDKRTMLEGRLRRRLRTLNLASYSEYCNYLFDGQGHDAEEMVHLIDAVSTNKTDFFREKDHFEYLAAKALPDITQRHGNEFRIWSAGCSSGEEPYTMAIVLNEYARTHAGFRYRIFATDISTVILEKAAQAIYPDTLVAPVPQELRRRYFMRSKDPESNLMRVVPELRGKIEFQRLNLMEEFGLKEQFHAIFCRNVIIYFDRPTQERLFQRFSRQLVDGGYVFIGHSESLSNMNVPLAPIAAALYKKSEPNAGNRD